MTRGWYLIALAAATVATGAESKPGIGIFMDFDAPPAALTMETMKREVEAILRPSGLQLGWRSLKENRGTEAFAGVVVVRFRGACEAKALADAGEPGETVTLGWSRVSEGRVLPFSEVECDQVRKTVAYGDPATDLERQHALGRAMGRVVAHELYHMLASTTGHAAHGLARATQDFRDLVTGTMSFGPRDAAAIRNSFR